MRCPGFLWPWRPRAAAPLPAIPAPPVVTDETLARARGISAETVARARRRTPLIQPFRAAQHPPMVTPKGGLAQDEALIGPQSPISWAAGAFTEAGLEGVTFLGYPVLAEMAQRPEYRRPVEIIARHMTRKWIRLQAKGDKDKSKRIAAIEDVLTDLKARDIFREAAEQDGFFGRSHIFLDFGSDAPDELRSPIGDGRNAASKAKVKRGSLRKLRTVEAVWCYPTGYNSSNPLSDDWYKPNTWLVMGKEVHASRLFTLLGREVPDMLKPAYSFGGLSLTQMLRPYVDNWLRTRQSVADITGAFSTFVLKTNLAEQVMVNGEQLFRRAELFNLVRDNRGLLMVDKTTEDFGNVSAPLSTLDVLQAQSQEHMASVCGIPLVELFGIQPAGLNASSDGEIRTFYAMLHSVQETLFRDPLNRLLGFIQLSEFGDVDPDIVFDFEPLWAMSDKEEAEVRKMEADTDVALIETGVLAPVEARRRIADDPDTPYAGLDAEDVPLPPASEFGPEGEEDGPPEPQKPGGEKGGEKDAPATAKKDDGKDKPTPAAKERKPPDRDAK